MKAKKSSSSRMAATMEAYYTKGHAGWDMGRPQKAIRRLVRETKLDDPILDVGCGTGDHALLFASKGHTVTGIDIAPSAILSAERKARLHSVENVTFVHADFLSWSTRTRFRTMFDVGMFHCLAEADVARYLKQVARVLRLHAGFYLMCIAASPHEDSDFPHPYNAAELTEIFSPVCAIDAVEAVRDESTFCPEGFPAWLMKGRFRG
jgi:cyclopropane fatty-acyl-phospholipid synthase-like methyltransferase